MSCFFVLCKSTKTKIPLACYTLYVQIIYAMQTHVNIDTCKSSRHHVDRGQSDAHAGNSVWNSQPGPYCMNMTLR